MASIQLPKGHIRSIDRARSYSVLSLNSGDGGSGGLLSTGLPGVGGLAGSLAAHDHRGAGDGSLASTEERIDRVDRSVRYSWLVSKIAPSLSPCPSISLHDRSYSVLQTRCSPSCFAGIGFHPYSDSTFLPAKAEKSKGDGVARGQARLAGHGLLANVFLAPLIRPAPHRVFRPVQVGSSAVQSPPFPSSSLRCLALRFLPL